MEQPVSPPKPVVSGLLSPLFPVVIFLVFLGLAAGLRYGLVQQDKRQIEANLTNQRRRNDHDVASHQLYQKDHAGL